MLAGRDLSLVYSDAGAELRAVDGVSLEVGPGEFVAILGPSGSGKSSLLYLLAGLKRPTAGTVSYGGSDLGALDADPLAEFRRRTFGFVFQNHFLIHYLTALENVQASGNGEAGRLLEDLGLAPCRDKFPWQMSAGEKQRVAIARAVVHRPPVVFADEPTASLDRASAGVVVECLRSAARGGALVMVTHDESIAAGATRILRMSGGMIM